MKQINDTHRLDAPYIYILNTLYYYFYTINHMVIYLTWAKGNYYEEFSFEIVVANNNKKKTSGCTCRFPGF